MPRALLLLVLSATVAAQSPRSLEPGTAKILEAVMGRHPFQAFAALGRGEPDKTRAKWKGREAISDVKSAVTAAALAGLWSKDKDIARGASNLIDEYVLDVPDIERYQDVVIELMFARGKVVELASDLVDFDVFKHTISRGRIAAVLQKVTDFNSDFRHFYIINLHRSVRPEHVPSLCKLVHHQDPKLRKQAWNVLCTVSRYTDRFHKEVGRTVLSRPGPVPESELGVEDPSKLAEYEPEKIDLREKPKGYSALLSAVLRRSYLTERQQRERWPDPWVARWAAREKPAVTDVSLLLELLEGKPWQARRIALRGLMALDDAASRDALVAKMLVLQKTELAMCYAALAGRGISEWRINLDRAARANAVMLAAALEVMPKLAVDNWAASALGPDAKQGLLSVKRLGKALDNGRHSPFIISGATLHGLSAKVDERAAKLDAPRLRLLIRTFPECRSRVVADAYLANLKTGDDLRECELAFLEVSNEKALRSRLTDFLKQRDRKDPALDLFMRLGTPELGDALARRWPFQKDHPLHVLARSGASKAVRAMLAKRVEGMELPADKEKLRSDWFNPLTALAMAHGLPERTCIVWSGELAQLPRGMLRKHWKEWCKAVIAGKPIDALMAHLHAVPAHELWFRHLGLVKDPRVIDFLRGLRKHPGARVQWVIGELATAGDAAALATMRVVRNRAYYGWPDELHGRTLIPGRDLGLVPYWIGEIETNCCRRVAANKALENLYGFDIFEQVEDNALVTQYEGAWLWWRRFQGQLVWSKVAGRYVIGPK